MRTILLALALCATALPAAAQGQHVCAGDAAKAALKLLKLHTDGDDRATVDDRVRKIGIVKALVGSKMLDVLEVEGSVYKANYRIRLIYTLFSGAPRCGLMGQEILERSDPS